MLVFADIFAYVLNGWFLATRENYTNFVHSSQKHQNDVNRLRKYLAHCSFVFVVALNLSNLHLPS